MIRHAFLGLAVSTCLVACLGKTTSLGGPDGQSGGSPTPPDTVAGGLIAPARAPRNDTTGDAGSPSPLGICHGYSWAPVPSLALCEYELPPPDVNPALDPRRWDPANVAIFTLVEATNKRNVGQYVGSAAGCATSDGWYYVDAGADADADAGPTRTLFAICPKSCASVTNEGALLRLSATTYCE